MANSGRYLPQLPRISPDEAYEEYKDDLETDGELDLEKVKDMVLQYDWLRKNYCAILESPLQDHFSKPGTHASWVIAAIEDQFTDTLMRDVEELLIVLRAGGYMGETSEEVVRNWFAYDEWLKEQP